MLLVTAALSAIALAVPATADRASASLDVVVEARAASLPPVPPIASPTAPVDGLDSEPVRFDTRDGRTLAGTFYPVPKAKDPTPAVLLVHDLGADRAELAPLVERLVRRDLAVLAFDLRGHGESATEECDWAKLEEVERERLTPFMVLDLNAAMDWLADDTRVAGVRQHLIGRGFGALLAARAASDERVATLNLLEPELDKYGFDLLEMLPDAAGLPTQVTVRDQDEERFEKLVLERECDDFCEVKGVKAKPGEVVEDRRWASNLSKWLDARRDGAAGRSHAVRGRRR